MKILALVILAVAIAGVKPANAQRCVMDIAIAVALVGQAKAGPEIWPRAWNDDHEFRRELHRQMQECASAETWQGVRNEMYPEIGDSAQQRLNQKRTARVIDLYLAGALLPPGH